MERGAGAGALIPDSQYEEAGAQMVKDPGEVYDAEVVVKVAAPDLQRDRTARVR